MSAGCGDEAAGIDDAHEFEVCLSNERWRWQSAASSLPSRNTLLKAEGYGMGALARNPDRRRVVRARESDDEYDERMMVRHTLLALTAVVRQRSEG